MTKKRYHSVDYYTQNFRDWLDQYLEKKYGAGWNISCSIFGVGEERKGLVDFTIKGVNSGLEFIVNGTKVGVNVNISLGDKQIDFRKKLQIKRTKTGRVKPAVYESFFKNYLLPAIKEIGS